MGSNMIFDMDFNTYKTTLRVVRRLEGAERVGRLRPWVGVQISMVSLQKSMKRAPHEQKSAIFALLMFS